MIKLGRYDAITTHNILLSSIITTTAFIYVITRWFLYLSFAWNFNLVICKHYRHIVLQFIVSIDIFFLNFRRFFSIAIFLYCDFFLFNFDFLLQYFKNVMKFIQRESIQVEIVINRMLREKLSHISCSICGVGLF